MFEPTTIAIVVALFLVWSVLYAAGLLFRGAA